MLHGTIRKPATVAVCGLLACMLAVSGASAAEELQVREIKVTATRTERDLMAVPMSVGVVSGSDSIRNPQSNVAEALAHIPGVTVMDGSMPGGKRVMIRGESPTRSLLLIDGMKISEQKSMSGSAILIDTSQIERIEVIKGPASVLYGSEAIGGVVNIITKKGGDKPIGFSQNVNFDASNDAVDIQSAVFGSYNGFNYRFSGSGINAGNLRGGDGRIANSDWKNRNYTGQIGYDWDKGSVFIRADKYESRISIPTNISENRYQFGASAGQTNRTVVALDLPKWDRKSLSGGLELRELSDYLAKVKVNAYMQNMEKDFYNSVRAGNVNPMMGVVPMAVGPNIHTLNDQNSYGGSLQTEWTFGKNHYVTAGLDYNLDKLDAMSALSVVGVNGMTGVTMTMVPESISKYKVDQSTLGLFIQDEWALHQDWTLTLGVRETFVRSRITRSNDAAIPDGESKSDSRLVGNAGLVYSGINDVALRAMWSQGYRFPSLNQLFLGTSHGGTVSTYPNPDLKPEKSNSFELGARIAKANWNIDIAAFYTDSDNYITTEVTPTGDEMFANMDKARTFGAELGVEYTFADWNLTPYTSVTWLHREYENTINHLTDGYTKFKRSKTGTPPLQGVVGVKWNKGIASSTTLFTDAHVRWAMRAETERYDRTYAGNFVTDKDGGWGTVNVAAGLQGTGDFKWHLTLALRNLANKTYRQAANTLVDPGMHAVISTGMEF